MITNSTSPEEDLNFLKSLESSVPQQLKNLPKGRTPGASGDKYRAALDQVNAKYGGWKSFQSAIGGEVKKPDQETKTVSAPTQPPREQTKPSESKLDVDEIPVTASRKPQRVPLMAKDPISALAVTARREDPSLPREDDPTFTVSARRQSPTLGTRSPQPLDPLTVSSRREDPSLPKEDDPTFTVSARRQSTDLGPIAPKRVSLSVPEKPKPQRTFLQVEEYKFNDLYTDKNFIQAARRYYAKMDDEEFPQGPDGDRRAVDYAINDRRWKDNVTWSMASELVDTAVKVGDKYANRQDLQDLKVIKETFEKVPGGVPRIITGVAEGDLSEVAGGAGAVWGSVWRTALDPLSYFGPAVSRYVGMGVLKKTATSVVADATVTTGLTAGQQAVDINLGIREQMDPAALLLTFGTAAMVSGPTAYMGARATEPPTIDVGLAKTQAEAANAALRARGRTQLFGDAGATFTDSAARKAEEAAGTADAARTIAVAEKRKALIGRNTFKGEVTTYGAQDAPDFGMMTFSPNRPASQAEAAAVEKQTAEFNNAFLLTPRSIKDARELLNLQDAQILSAADLVIGLRDLGFDGVVVRGFDDILDKANKAPGANPQAYIDDAATKLKIAPGMIRDAVIPFDEANLSDYVPKKRTSGDKVEIEIADYVNPDLQERLLNPNSIERALADTFNIPIAKIEPVRQKIYDFISGRMTLLNDKEGYDALAKDFAKEFGDIVNIEAPNVGRVSWAQTEQAAKRALKGVDLGKAAAAIADMPAGRAMSSSETAFSRFVLAAVNEKWLQSVAKLKENKLDLDALTEVEKMKTLYDNVLAGYQGARSETGRALRYGASDPTSVTSLTQKTLGIVDKARERTGFFRTKEMVVKAAKDKVDTAKKAVAKAEAQQAAIYQKLQMAKARNLEKDATRLEKEAEKAAREVEKAKANFEKTNQKAIEDVKRDAGVDIDADTQIAIYDAVTDLAARNDKQLVELFFINLKQQTVLGPDQVKELWYNSLLSGIPTQSINAMGMLSMAVQKTVEDSLAAASSGAPITPVMAGYAHAVPKMFKVFKETFRSEIPFDPVTRLEVKSNQTLPSWVVDSISGKPLFGAFGPKVRRAGVGEAGAIGGRQARLPGRFLMSMDDAFKVYFYDGAMTTAAIMEIRNLEAKQGSKLTRKEFVQAIERFKKDPPPQAVEYAREQARTMTLTNELGPIGQGMTRLVRDTPGMFLFVPFIRTPVNAIKRGLDTIWMTQRNKDDFMAGGVRAEQAKWRLGMGAMGVATIAYLAASENTVTGAGPTEPSEREAWLQNNRPFSFYVKPWNAWVEFNRFDPYAIPAALAAGIKDIDIYSKDPERQEAFFSALNHLVAEALINKTFFQGLDNMFQLVSGDGVEATVKGVATSFIPAIANNVSRVVDPRTTAPVTLIEAMKSRIGYERGTEVPLKYDYRGRQEYQDVVGSTGEEGRRGVVAVIARLITPFRTKLGPRDKIDREIEELRIKIPPVQRTWNGVKLDGFQKSLYQRVRGERFDQWLQAVNVEGWDKLSIADRRVYIQNALSNANEEADKILMGTYPELAAKYLSPYKVEGLKEMFRPTKTDLERKEMLSLNPEFDRK